MEIKMKMINHESAPSELLKLCLTALTLSALTLMSGCGAETERSGTSLYDDQELEMISGAEAPGGEEVGGSTTGGESATGERFEAPEVWARQHVMIGLAELPAFGIQLSETRTILRTVISRERGVFRSREETCSIEILRPEAEAVQTIIPQTFIESISLFNRALNIEGDQIEYAQLIQVQGAHLRDATADTLPTELDDPRVFDQDQDGQPGLTLLIAGIIEGDLQIVQRLTTQLSGQLNGDRMEGVLTWTTEEPVLNGSNDILNRDVPVVPHPELQSYFVGQRVDPSLTCAELVTESASLFWVPETLPAP